MWVHIFHDAEGWAYHRRALALQKYAPNDIQITQSWYREGHDVAAQSDIVFLLPYGACADIREQIGARPILLCGYNVGPGYRAEKFAFLKEHADHVLFNNRANWDYHKRPPNTTWISNGVDRDLFHPIKPVSERSNRVLSIGSDYHFRHNDDLKGVRILGSIRSRLREAGIELDVRVVNSTHPPMAQTEMQEWYNAGSAYVVASRMEGTPNPALEAASCGLPLVTTRVGNMPELVEHGVNGYFVDREAGSICQGIIDAITNKDRLSSAMLKSITPWDWSVVAQLYYCLFRNLIARKTEVD